MDEDTIFFQKLFYGGMGYVAKCEHVEINKNVRIYFKQHEGQRGFYFCAVEFSCVECCESYPVNYDVFQDPTFKAFVLFYGIAHYDGIRHMEMGSKHTDNENYLFYPNSKVLSEIFSKLNEMEKKYCMVSAHE